MKEQTIWTKEEGWKEFVIISNSDVTVVEKEEKIKEEKMNNKETEKFCEKHECWASICAVTLLTGKNHSHCKCDS